MKPFSLYIVLFALAACAVYGLNIGGAQAIINSNPVTRNFELPTLTNEKSSDQGNLNKMLNGVGVKVTFTDV